MEFRGVLTGLLPGTEMDRNSVKTQPRPWMQRERHSPSSLPHKHMQDSTPVKVTTKPGTSAPDRATLQISQFIVSF